MIDHSHDNEFNGQFNLDSKGGMVLICTNCYWHMELPSYPSLDAINLRARSHIRICKKEEKTP